MMLTKCCHDLDLLVWLFGPCERLASYGSLTRFVRDAIDVAVPDRCTDGCPIEGTCPYYAPRVYLTRFRENPNSFAVHALTLDQSEDGIMHALRTGPYGRCVYRCDNDAVDHQVVLLRFARGVDVSLTMQGASHVEGRTVRIGGRGGERRERRDRGLPREGRRQLTYRSLGPIPLPERGQRATGSFTFADDPSLAKYRWPFLAIGGQQSGPTFLVTAGIHAAEYTGIEAAIRLGRTLEPTAVRGTIVVIP